jgi:ParB/RepB/Spo0J family partition protein
MTLKQNLEYVALSSLKVSPQNSRSESVGEQNQDWDDFKEDIKQNGILQPLLVRKDGETKGEYWVIDGRRRLFALQELNSNREGKPIPGAPAVHCEVVEVKEAIEELTLSSVGNLHRMDLTPLEWSEVIAKMKKMNLPQNEIAKRLHRSKSWVSQAKEGKPWSEHRKTTESRQLPQAREFEETECPICGGALKPSIQEGKIRLEAIGEEQRKKPRTGKGGKKK